MSLNNYRVGAAVAVSDMDRAKEFYEGRLGLTAAGGDAPDGGRTYEMWRADDTPRLPLDSRRSPVRRDDRWLARGRPRARRR